MKIDLDLVKSRLNVPEGVTVRYDNWFDDGIIKVQVVPFRRPSYGTTYHFLDDLEETPIDEMVRDIQQMIDISYAKALKIEAAKEAIKKC